MAVWMTMGTLAKISEVGEYRNFYKLINGKGRMATTPKMMMMMMMMMKLQQDDNKIGEKNRSESDSKLRHDDSPDHIVHTLLINDDVVVNSQSEESKMPQWI
jgi:hypothetical protein